MGDSHLYLGFPLLEVAEPSAHQMTMGPVEADHIVWARSLRDAKIVEEALNSRAANKLMDQFSSRWRFELRGEEPIGAELGINLEWAAKKHLEWSRRKHLSNLLSPRPQFDDHPRSIIKCRRTNSMGAKTPLYYLEIT
jgi:hypothetical protein